MKVGMSGVARLLTVGAALGVSSAALEAQSRVLFSDDFEHGLAAWTFPVGVGHTLVRAPGRSGTALALEVVDEPVYALIRGSDGWGPVRVEGDVLFPDDDHNYLGFIYGYRDDGRRIDFGSLYIKGNGSYVQGNTHRDTNVGRTWLPEYRAPLTGTGEIVIGRWSRFALEVADGTAHLYVGDMQQPVLTLPDAGERPGPIGFKPRNPGASVLLDNVTARAIDGLTWRGPGIPETPYRPEAYLTDWEVFGPLPAHDAAVERGSATDRPWRRLRTDGRGAVRTGDVTEFRGDRRIAYFRTRWMAEESTTAMLGLSTVDDLAIWVNGVFWGFAARRDFAWWDAAWNGARASIRTPIDVRRGRNEVVIRVTGGVYATGGFFAWIEPPPDG